VAEVLTELAHGYLADQGVAYAGGRERTESEFTQLLDQARLRLVSAIPLAAGPHVLEAVAV
jgi:hypothetical protein